MCQKDPICSRHEYKVDPLVLEEEQFNKRYYLDHPDLNLDIPCSKNVAAPMVESIDSPYQHDTTYRRTRMHRNHMTDSVLDYYRTDIYGKISPNYIPTVLHSHTYFEIVYILSGHCINYSGDQKLMLSEGDFLVIAPNTIHGISAFNDQCRLTNIMIRSYTFHSTFFPEFLESSILFSAFSNTLYNNKTNAYLLFHTQKDNLIKTLFLCLLDEISHHRPYQDQTKTAYLKLIFSRLINRHSGNVEIFNDGIRNVTQEVTMILTYMQEHYQMVRLGELASFFGYSERQLTRILINYTQKNFSDNMVEIKMRHAAQLLQNHQNTIDDIAGKLGYSTCYGFRKKFKEYFGTTPSDYRKSN